jgi:putative hydrolase of the HAD superfamily
VFFDAGETLVHPHPSFPELLAVVLQEEGFAVDPQTIRERLSVVASEFSKPSAVGWSTSPERSRAFWEGLYRLLLGALGIPFTDGVAEVIYRTFTDLGSYRAFPDAEPTLRQLREAGLTVGLISNFEAWLEQLLEHTGLAEYFDIRAISGVEGVEKPDPRIFRVALERAGVEADDVAYVGDSPEFDIEPAETLGMLGVLIDRRGRFPDHAGTRIETLDELSGALGLDLSPAPADERS